MTPIKGFEQSYYIDASGVVYSRYSNRPLKCWISNNGYVCVDLYLNRKHFKRKVHRLVAETFIPNINNKPQVNHKDGNKQNNNVTNLEWCTQAENNQHAWNTGLSKAYIRIGDKNPNSKLSPTDVQAIKLLLTKFSNVAYIAKLFKVRPSTIHSIRDQKRWTHIQ